MTFNYENLKKQLESKYSDRIPKKEIQELLTFERGVLKNTFPQKRLIINRLLFNGTKANIGFSFDRNFSEGINLLLADNFKGKSSVFKIIKYAITGDDDLAKDIKSWIKNVYVEFSLISDLGNRVFTSYLNFDKSRMNGTLFSIKINEIIDKEIDQDKIVFQSDTGTAFKSFIQEFFFREFDFYHLNWTQKSSAKDKNELIEAKASWNTYYESIYLASRNSDKLAYGGQEELIFQMLLGLKLTHPINKLKVKYEMTQFELGKIREAKKWDAQKKDADLYGLKKELEKVEREIEKLRNKELKSINVSDYFTERSLLIEEVSKRNQNIVNLEDTRNNLDREINRFRFDNQDINAQVKRYVDLIKKASKVKIDLEEYLQFGIFFSNLEITVCPHCNTSVSKEIDANGTECQLCNSNINHSNHADKSHYEAKIESVKSEILGYQKQIELLNEKVNNDRTKIDEVKDRVKSIESEISNISKKNKEDYKRIKEIDTIVLSANKDAQIIERLFELEKRKAVLDFRLDDYRTKSSISSDEKESIYEAKIGMLLEALNRLKEERTKENEAILANFKELLLQELRDLGIIGITEIRLSDSFKVSYNQNGNWVSFDEISEGEQLRVKIAFYLSIIQCDIKYNAGKHPRLLIIDSPNKEEGDRLYRDGLKKLLINISDKYGEHLQIIIGTASRELEGSVDPSRAIIFPEGQYLF